MMEKTKVQIHTCVEEEASFKIKESRIGINRKSV
jgi:hypothetical protein